MNGRRGSFVAAEGVPFLLAMAALSGAAWYFGGFDRAAAPLLLLICVYLVFRDPHRDVPAAALGVVSPVDGRVFSLETNSDGVLDGEVHRIVIRINSFGTYTARSPVEGKIMDLGGLANAQSPTHVETGLWLLTDEGHNVALRFHGHRFGIAPRAFIRYGERVGQGQRCAYLRLTKFAEIELPGSGRILVEKGQRVSAGRDVLAKLPAS